MAFTTQVFLFIFLPISLILYFAVYFIQKIKFFNKVLSKIRAIDLVTIALSCGFYAWACFDDILRLFAFIIAIYVFGLILKTQNKKPKYILIENENSTKKFPFSLIWLAIFISIIIFILFYYKYTYMFARVWNFLFKDKITSKSLVAPLGLSFIVFSSVSYLVDVYRGDANAGSLIDCALYITFFPKVVSGPIVLWKDFSPQIKEKQVSLSNVSNGVVRLMIGFAKKLILADTFGACISSMGKVIDVPTAWGSGILYTLQIYFDFSGYSDIAIGLGLILGYSFKENFNFPYLSRSITEFWRRWHVSLGTWFKQYVYIPLGGNRKGTKRTLFNIAVVFVLTGIWHGAFWTYLLWGAINGFFNCVEKLLANNKIYQKTPNVVKWLVTMTIVFFCWQIFRFSTISDLKFHIKSMLGMNDTTELYYTWQYYFDTRIIVFAVIGAICSTIFGLPKIQLAYDKIVKTKIGYAINFIIVLALFIFSIMFMVNSKYSPFIYFQY